MGIFLSTVSIILFIVETALQINVAVILYFQSNFQSFAFIISLVTGAMVLSNIISAFLVLRTMDFSGKWIGKIICVFLHLAQFGLIWRCLKLYILFDEHDWREFVSLRLLHTAIQSLPFLIIEGFVILNSMNFGADLIASTIITLISSSVALAMFNMNQCLFESDEFLEFKAKIRKPFGVVFLVIGTFLVLLSRCGSIILMAISMTHWVFLPIGLHVLLYILFVSLSNVCQNKCSLKRNLRNLVFSYVNIFDIIDIGFKRIQCKNVIYYAAILTENIIMAAFWMLTSNVDYVFKLCTIVVLLVSFICGIVFKFCSCGCVNPEIDDPLSEDTLTFGIERTRDNMNKSKTQRHESILSNEIKRSENKIIFSSHSFTQGRKIEIIETKIPNGIDINVTRVPNGSINRATRVPKGIDNIENSILPNGIDNSAFQVHEEPLSVNAQIYPTNETNYLELGKASSPSLSPNISNRRSLNDPRRTRRSAHYHGSNAEIASSNSRNTNTLNISVNSCNNCHELVDDRKTNTLSIGANSYNKYHELADDRDTNILNISANSCNDRHELEDDRNAQDISYHISGHVAPPSVSAKHISEVDSRTNTPSSNDHKDARTNNTQIKQRPNSGRITPNKKAAIPLYPNECSSYIQPKSPKFSHVFDNPINHNDIDDSISNTSCSEYLSYSYYIDSTEWSTTSWDSEYAMTWPPSNPIILVNLHSLPKERISTNDNVQLWLSQLDDWEPSFELNEQNNFDSIVDNVQYQADILRQSPQNSRSNISDMKYDKSLYLDQRYIKSEQGQISYSKSEQGKNSSKKSKRKLSNLSSALKHSFSKLRNSKEKKHSADVPEVRTDKHGYVNDSMIGWRDDNDTQSPHTVQESMV